LLVSDASLTNFACSNHKLFRSESLIPRPADWKPNISVVGFFKLPQSLDYKPPPSLTRFLEAGPRPIYIGFGSIVLNNPDAFTNTILEAVRLTGTRAVISKGWGGIGASSLHLSSNIYMLDDCPHTWLFPQVDCVVHHGGAGTTSAGLSFGRPTVVVPFFGDQMIWGEAIHRAGAGPRPIPWKSLTAELLAEAIMTALSPQIAATATDLAYLLGTEDGTRDGVRSLYRALPTHDMTCSILKDRKAVWKLSRSSLRLSAGAAELLLLEGLLDSKDLHP
jgi:UDP:flavonoid glycosyltransferase YjiC (YdhE family)